MEAMLSMDAICFKQNSGVFFLQLTGVPTVSHCHVRPEGTEASSHRAFLLQTCSVEWGVGSRNNYVNNSPSKVNHLQTLLRFIPITPSWYVAFYVKAYFKNEMKK
ncbi:hypothetical protein NPIL_382911 [Nephila pilipes]|uniref:Uncharacterized protein n=1 Tax=Nephila pilipes TaxID=299642 RepID=A0A8X6UIA0_NEPPI|nr:hypothetical protein NPIL_382911 [Nephila pilipes]